MIVAVLLFAAEGVAQQIPPPAVHFVAPTRGVAGTLITINGVNLHALPACLECPVGPRVFIGHLPAVVRGWTTTQITAEIPQMHAGLYEVRVVRGDGQAAVAPAAYSFAYGGRTANDRFERVLIPIVVSGVMPGARGSRWISELSGRNDGSNAIIVSQNPEPCTQVHCDDPQWVAARTTFVPPVVPWFNGGGALLYVEQEELNGRVAITLRIRDSAREAEGWGTQIPVVHERFAFINRPIQLLDIPIGPRSRQMLRIYDFDGPLGRRVRVRLFANDTNDPLADLEAGMSGRGSLEPPVAALPPVPGYAQLDLGTLLPAAFFAGRVRVLIDGPSDARLWAFVSITNNETQQVTTVTPQ